MRTTGTKWTKEEENILQQAVKTHPNNMRKAFKEVQEKTGRSAGAVYLRWYNKINKKSSTYTKNRDLQIVEYKSKQSKTIYKDVIFKIGNTLIKSAEVEVIS